MTNQFNEDDIPVDPFSLANDPFDNMSMDESWDSFTNYLNDLDKRKPFFDGPEPFAAPTFIHQEIPTQHRRAVSSPMHLINSGNRSLDGPLFCVPQRLDQLPVAISTFDYTSNLMQRQQRNFRDIASPKPSLKNSENMFDESIFISACKNPTLTFNPKLIGFIPSNLWTDKTMTFGEIVANFFQKKNNANSRFSHKLFNALKLSECSPVFPPLVGVSWLTPSILRVDKRVFARLLGIKSIDGSLFHQQGNFPSHGFFEIGAGDASTLCPPGINLNGVDFENVRLLFHSDKKFIQGCTEYDVMNCRWANNHSHR